MCIPDSHRPPQNLSGGIPYHTPLTYSISQQELNKSVKKEQQKVYANVSFIISYMIQLHMDQITKFGSYSQRWFEPSNVDSGHYFDTQLVLKLKGTEDINVLTLSWQ